MAVKSEAPQRNCPLISLFIWSISRQELGDQVHLSNGLFRSFKADAGAITVARRRLQINTEGRILRFITDIFMAPLVRTPTSYRIDIIANQRIDGVRVVFGSACSCFENFVVRFFNGVALTWEGKCYCCLFLVHRKIFSFVLCIYIRSVRD